MNLPPLAYPTVALLFVGWLGLFLAVICRRFLRHG